MHGNDEGDGQVNKQEKHVYAALLAISVFYVLCLPILAIVGMEFMLYLTNDDLFVAVLKNEAIHATYLVETVIGTAMTAIALRKYRLKYAWPMISVLPVMEVVRMILDVLEERSRPTSIIGGADSEMLLICIKNGLVLLSVAVILLLIVWGVSALLRKTWDVVYCLAVLACCLGFYILVASLLFRNRAFSITALRTIVSMSGAIGLLSWAGCVLVGWVRGSAENRAGKTKPGA